MKIKPYFILFFFITSFFVFVFSSPTTLAEVIKLTNPLKANSFEGVLSNLMDWLVKLGAPLAALMIIVGGAQMLFSGGDPGKFKKGQQTILYTAIGYGIIIIGSGIINIIKVLLGSK